MLLGSSPSPGAGVVNVVAGEPAEQSAARTLTDQREAAVPKSFRQIRRADVSRRLALDALVRAIVFILDGKLHTVQPAGMDCRLFVLN